MVKMGNRNGGSDSGGCTHNLRAPRLSEDSALCTGRRGDQLMYRMGARVNLRTAIATVTVSDNNSLSLVQTFHCSHITSDGIETTGFYGYKNVVSNEL